MAKNEIETEAQAHVIDLPVYLRSMRYPKLIKIAKLAETLKLIARDKALSYAKDEFEREFGDITKFKARIHTYLIKDKGNIILFANEINPRSK